MREVWKHLRLNSDDIVLSECGIQQFLPDQRYSYTATETFILHYVESGKGEFLVNNRTYYSTNFNGFILHRGEYVSYKGDNKNPWKNYWIGLKGNDVRNFLKNLTIDQINTFTFHPNSTVVRIIKEICIETKENEYVSELWYKQKTYELLYHMQKEFEIPNHIAINTTLNPVFEIFEYICKNYQNHLSIDELVSSFGISRTSFFRKFKAEYNRTPKQFILESQINKASQLLKESDYPIREIADIVGFDDYAVFSKAFKKLTGEAPRHYRQNVKSKEIYETSASKNNHL